MPHYKQTLPSPHPQNPERTHTLLCNTDCPRCGGSLNEVDVEPGDLLHCPHCEGALEACGRVEDGGQDRTKNIVTISWLQPSRFGAVAGPDCDCGGCVARRALLASRPEEGSR